MATALKLVRKGNRNRPFYHMVAIDSRHKLSGLYLEKLGVYDPLGETHLAIDENAVRRWIQRGARMSPVVKKLLKRSGIATHYIPEVKSDATGAV